MNVNLVSLWLESSFSIDRLWVESIRVTSEMLYVRGFLLDGRSAMDWDYDCTDVLWKWRGASSELQEIRSIKIFELLLYPKQQRPPCNWRSWPPYCFNWSFTIGRWRLGGAQSHLVEKQLWAVLRTTLFWPALSRNHNLTTLAAVAAEFTDLGGRVDSCGT